MTGHFRSYGIIEVPESGKHREHWQIIFNREDDKEVRITMDIPKQGVLENPADEVDKPLAERLADMIASVIRNTLTHPSDEQD